MLQAESTQAEPGRSFVLRAETGSLSGLARAVALGAPAFDRQQVIAFDLGRRRVGPQRDFHPDAATIHINRSLAALENATFHQLPAHSEGCRLAETSIEHAVQVFRLREDLDVRGDSAFFS